MDRSLIASAMPIIARSHGLVLREWEYRDVPCMVTMFNTAEMDRWTPLTHPFDADEAVAYVERARQARVTGTLQLAITEDGQTPLGEVLLFPTDVMATCELAYAVGAENRGRALAARAVQAILPLARAEGYRSARLKIAIDNLVSQHVAAAAGFAVTDEPLQPRERKGYLLDMATWARNIV